MTYKKMLRIYRSLSAELEQWYARHPQHSGPHDPQDAPVVWHLHQAARQASSEEQAAQLMNALLAEHAGKFDPIEGELAVAEAGALRQLMIRTELKPLAPYDAYSITDVQPGGQTSMGPQSIIEVW